MSMKWSSVFLLTQLICYCRLGTCGKVLVWPMEYSHWINMKIILEELVERGHEVTVLTSSASILIDSSRSSIIKFEIFPTSVRKEEVEDMFSKWITLLIDNLGKYSVWTHYSKMQKVFSEYSHMNENFCKSVVWNKNLMKKLQESKFDVVLADAIGPCGELLAEILKIPLVYTLRYCPGYTYEKYSGGLPVPPSYVPMVLSELTDQMTFVERIKNMMNALYFNFWFETFNEKNWNQLYTEVLGRPTTLSELMGKAEIWLIRTYWDLEFPRPFLPNFEFVGGLHCKPAKPLPKEMEDFVQSSGEHGFVVFSLGSMVSNMTEEKANVVASALAQIPQKVLWRFDGKKPDTLGSNTRLYKWIPQNDLLELQSGNEVTKNAIDYTKSYSQCLESKRPFSSAMTTATRIVQWLTGLFPSLISWSSQNQSFYNSRGTNGIYEAIYHGIPVVGIPLFADQPDNIVHMVAKGAAVRLDYSSLSTTDILTALRTVINDPSYKENAMRLSRIQRDQPMKPLDRAVFWIEYVMRHKGAKHLRVAAHDLSWFQYHSLDVTGFLLACVAAVVFIIIKCCLFCCQKIAKCGKKNKKE